MVGNLFLKNERAMSSIVTTAIIILIVLVSVAIIWVFTKDIIEKEKQEISLGKFTIDLEIKSFQVLSDDEISINVKRNPGEGNFTGLRFVFDDCVDSEIYDEGSSLNQLEERKFSFNLQELNPDFVRKIYVIPVLKDSGKNVLFGREFFYEIGSCDYERNFSSGGENNSIAEIILENLFYIPKWNILGELVNSSMFDGEIYTGFNFYGDVFSALFYSGWGGFISINDGKEFFIENYQGKIEIGDVFGESTNTSLIVDAPNSNFIFKNGKVGIGIITPQNTLNVLGDGNFTGQFYLPNINAGTNNSVLIKDSNGTIKTDEIDSRVWGSSLVGGGGAGDTEQVAWFTTTSSIAGTDNFKWNIFHNRLDVIGDIRASGDFINDGNYGLTGVYDIGSCLITFSSGIITNSTC